MDEEAPLFSAWNPLEVINDLQVAIEVAEGPGPWRVAYPQGRVQVTGESFQVRLREEETIVVTVLTSQFAHRRERKVVMVSAVDEEFHRRVDSWLKKEQTAVRDEEKQGRRRAEELEKMTTSTRDTHEVPPDASFALFASWGPLIGYTLRHTCLADGLSRQRWRREAENRVRDRTIMFEGKISEEPGTACIASWPGLYATAWHYLARQARGGQTSAAVVFLPEGTQYYGNHCPIPVEEGLCGACWCFALYGEEKEWGCQWWSVWIENIHKAMQYGAVLHVYFWQGLRSKGKVASFATVGQENLVRESVRKKMQDFERSKEYEDAKQAGLLKLSNEKRYDRSSQQSREVQRLFRKWLPPEERRILEDAEGLGDSQRAEVAWLDRKGYPYIEMDVSPFLQPSDGDTQDQEEPLDARHSVQDFQESVKDGKFMVAFHPLVINDLQVAIEIACQEGQFRVLYPEGRAQVASRSFQMRLREDERIAVTVKSSKFAHTDDLIASQVDEDFRQRVEHWLKREQRATREEEEQERLRAAELEEKMRSSQCHRRILSKETVCLVWVTVGLAISYCVCFLNWFAFVAFAWKLLGFAGAVCLALLFFCMDRATSNTTTWQNSLLWMASAFLCFGSCYVFLRILQDEQYNSQVYEAPKYVVLVVVAFSATGPIIGIVARRMCLASGLQRRQWHQGASFEGRISQEHAHGQQTSAAMVFPPKVTQCSGEHSPIPKEEGLQGECWCWALYGERRPSGCKWFAIWIQNIHRAMECGANLHVYFREGFRGRGKAASFASVGQENFSREKVRVKMKDFEKSNEFEDAKQAGLVRLSDMKRYDGSSQQSREKQRLFLGWLSAEDRKVLEDSEGLGDSQRAEVAWLDRKGYPYIEMDVSPFIQPSDEEGIAVDDVQPTLVQKELHSEL
ncbi:unnamed protein product [Durusdinium trenchii]|uniref:Uncharacterized protein n=1 Tax=Durusdinium trenchii TaxID=1381693 RepID=A0ABP0M8F8_9DINO